MYRRIGMVDECLRKTYIANDTGDLAGVKSSQGRINSLQLGGAFRALDGLLPRLWIRTWPQVFNDGFRR